MGPDVHAADRYTAGACEYMPVFGRWFRVVLSVVAHLHGGIR